MRFIRTHTAILALLLSIMGCSTGGKTIDGTSDHLPQPFTIDLRAFESGRRHVIYRLDSDGSLHFGGGRDASGHSAPKKAGALREEDRMRIWQIVQSYGLLDAAGGKSSGSPRVRYELSLRSGWRSHSMAGDEGTPGLKELDDLLFKIQAHNRFEAQLQEVPLPGQTPKK